VHVDHEEHVGEAELGRDIKDGVGDDLGVGGDLVRSLGEGEDDGVGGPENKGHSGEEGEESPRLPGSGLGGPHTASDKNPPDPEESDTADGEESPPGPLSRSPSGRDDAGEQTSDDHEHVGEDGKRGLVRRKAGEERKRNKQERGGETTNRSIGRRTALEGIDSCWRRGCGSGSGRK